MVHIVICDHVHEGSLEPADSDLMYRTVGAYHGAKNLKECEQQALSHNQRYQRLVKEDGGFPSTHTTPSTSSSTVHLHHST